MKMGKIVLTLAVVALGALAFAPETANAQTATTTFAVTAQVNRNCRISATALAFGAYDPIVANAAADLDGTSTISVACTRGSAGVWVGLNNGGNYAAARRMSDGAGAFLTYELYSENTRTTTWYNTQPTGLTWPLFNNSAAVDRTVYGRVAAAQDVPAGAYTDTITATVNF